MNMGSERLTIMLDADLSKKLRLRQSEQIKKEQKSISFSKVLNEALREVL